MKKLKIALIVDKIGWAFSSIATRISGDLSDMFIFRIFYTAEIRRDALLKELVHFSPDIVHFFWRKELNDIITDICDNPRLIPFRHFIEKTHITFSVPDHMYSTDASICNLLDAFHLADGYIVTSEKLFNIYSSKAHIRPPHCVIRDAYTPSAREPKNKNGKETSVIWIGDSAWGEWAGYRDYKGVKNIVKPLFNKLNNKYNGNIKLKIVDSSVSALSKTEVKEALSCADILVCASYNEGTPLPILEAMEFSCAIVTTDVGICCEIFPDEQKPFIVPRTVDDFYAAVCCLVENKPLLRNIQKRNLETFLELDDNKPADAWKLFFHSIIKTPVDSISRHARFSLNINFLGSAPLVLKYTHSKKIAASVARISTRRRHQTVRSSELHLESESVRRCLDGLNARKLDTLFIANPAWRGVYNSTSILSEGALLPLPRAPWKRSLDDAVIKRISELIVDSNLQQIVLSGGEFTHFRLARQLKQIRPSLTIGLIWHGQLAQWADRSEKDMFELWVESRKDSLVSKYGFMKRSLDRLVSKAGARSYRLSNYINCLELNTLSPLSLNESINIGLWSASNEYRKNILTQLLSIPLLNRCATAVHSLPIELSAALETTFNIKSDRISEGPIDGDVLRIAMNQTHLTLYVTLGECSPMIPLESLCAGSPALVGPVSDIYDCDEVMKTILTVGEPDTPSAIARGVEAAIEARESILARRAVFLKNTMTLGKSRLTRFLED